MMPTSIVSHILGTKYIFGMNGEMKNNIFFVDDHRILYPAGHNVVYYNIDDKSQSYYHGHDNFKGISKIAVSQTRRFLAIAEKGDKPAILIFDTMSQRKRKTLQIPDTTSKEYVCISFAPSQESKYLCCVSGPPDCTLYLWQWDKPKLLQSIKVISNVDIYDCAFSPNDSSLITVIGNKIFKCYKLIDNQLKLVHSQLNGSQIDISQNYSCHTWLYDGNLIICTANGEIIICDQNAEFQSLITENFAHSHGENSSIEVVIPFQKGFIIGTDNLLVKFYEADSNQQFTFQSTQSFTIKHAADLRHVKVRGLSITPNTEEKILASTSTNLVYSLTLKTETGIIDDNGWELVSPHSHFGYIYAMDVCVRKPLIATCGSDKSVSSIRIWNYEEKTLECVKYFAEGGEPKSITFHPSGFYVVVGFSDKLKIMNICPLNQQNQIKFFKDIPVKSCKEVSFSNGGQYFAAVNGSQNTQAIHVFNFYTGENPPHLIFKGHNGKVKCLSWSRDDTHLVSCGADGFIYLWKLSDGTRQDYIQKGTIVNSVCLASDNKTIYAVGSDRFVKEIVSDNNENRKFEAGVVLNTIQFTNSNKIMFAGVCDEQKSSGAIRCYRYPITGNYTDYQAHDALGVKRLKVTYDDQFLISIGRDGCLIIFEIKDKEAKGLKLKEGFTKYADEILVSKIDIEELKQQKDGLKQQALDLQQNANMIMNLTTKEDIIKSLKDQILTTSQQEKHKYEALMEAKREIELKYEDELKRMREENENQIQDLENIYRKKVVAECAKYEDLKRQQDIAFNEYQKKKKELVTEHQKQIRDLEDHFNAQLEEERNQKERISLEVEDLNQEHKEIINQVFEENNTEEKNLKEKYAEEIKTKNDLYLRAKSELTAITKRIQAQKQEKEELNGQKKECEESKVQLQKASEELKKEIDEEQKIIDEKDRLIGERERRIYELKKRTQELEKFKMVLDYKIKEFKREIGPREEEIKLMKDKTKELDEELKDMNALNNTLGDVVDQLDNALEAMNKSIQKQRNQISHQNNKIESFKDYVHQTVQHIQNYEKLKESVEQMYKTYAEGHVRPADIDPDIYNEYINQKKYLEKSVAMLKMNLQKDSEIHKQDNIRIMKDNVALISQINTLRKKIKEKKSNPNQSDKGNPLNQRKHTQSYKNGKMGSDNEEDMIIIEKQKKLEIQREIIEKLRNEMVNLERELNLLDDN